MALFVSEMPRRLQLGRFALTPSWFPVFSSLTCSISDRINLSLTPFYVYFSLLHYSPVMMNQSH